MEFRQGTALWEWLDINVENDCLYVRYEGFYRIVTEDERVTHWKRSGDPLGVTWWPTGSDLVAHWYISELSRRFLPKWASKARSGLFMGG